MTGYLHSVRSQWSGRRDSNPRPPVPQTGALPDFATPRIPRLGYCSRPSTRNGQGGGARTHDLLHPRQARYQAALHPVIEKTGTEGGTRTPTPRRHVILSHARLPIPPLPHPANSRSNCLALASTAASLTPKAARRPIVHGHLIRVAKPALPSAIPDNYRSGRGDRIRTCDLLLPKQPRYQPALRPDRKNGGGGEIRTHSSQRHRIYSPDQLSSAGAPPKKTSSQHGGAAGRVRTFTYLADTSPSSWRVYQFRHGRIGVIEGI